MNRAERIVKSELARKKRHMKRAIVEKRTQEEYRRLRKLRNQRKNTFSKRLSYTLGMATKPGFTESFFECPDGGSLYFRSYGNPKTNQSFACMGSPEMQMIFTS